MIKEKKSIYTAQELAEAHVFAHNLSPIEKMEVDAEMKSLRLQRLAKMSDTQKLQSDLLRLKFLMEDYIQQEVYSENQNFSSFLQAYLKILDKKQVDFAAEISLHPTKLNQILNNKTTPNIPLIYRIEKHSGGLISALLWWKIFTKKMEADIKNDTITRRSEAEKVHFQLAFN
jgi:transcriptional regulator with XRE-family HTH domain